MIDTEYGALGADVLMCATVGVVAVGLRALEQGDGDGVDIGRQQGRGRSSATMRVSLLELRYGLQRAARRLLSRCK